MDLPVDVRYSLTIIANWLRNQLHHCAAVGFPKLEHHLFLLLVQVQIVFQIKSQIVQGKILFYYVN